MELMGLYGYAEKQNIDVDWFSMGCAESLSVKLEDGSCSVAIDPWKLVSTADETVKLAHELGHCETGSFYNRYSPCDVRQKHENRADKWAIKKLIPKDELVKVLDCGIMNPWELAERFNVTEELMDKALLFYSETLSAKYSSACDYLL